MTRETDMIVIERDAAGVPTVWCDPGVVDLVTALNAAGLRTVASCSGHGYRPGVVSLRDGRHLLVCDDNQYARAAAAFPLDINGEEVRPRE